MFFKFYANDETRTQNPFFLAIIQAFVKMGVGDFHKMSWGSMEVVGVLFPWWGLTTFQLNFSLQILWHTSLFCLFYIYSCRKLSYFYAECFKRK